MIVDTFLKSKNKDALVALKGMYVNVMTPVKGTAATEAYEEDGMTIPAQPAKGDPEYWYTCVRAMGAIPASGEIELQTDEEIEAIARSWS